MRPFLVPRFLSPQFSVPRAGTALWLASLPLGPLPAWGQEGPILLLPAPAPRAAAPTNAGAPANIGTPTNIGTPAPATAATGNVMAGGAAAGSAATGSAVTGSLRTTTDSAEYCTELHGRVDNLARDAKTPKAEQALSLSQEGERLCKHGQMRSGILYLRRAFILIRPPEGSQDVARQAGR